MNRKVGHTKMEKYSAREKTKEKQKEREEKQAKFESMKSTK